MQNHKMCRIIILFLGVSSMIFVVKANFILRWIESNVPASVNFKISPKQNSSSDSLGTVNGARQCGGQGVLQEWRYESCYDSPTAADLCQVPAGKSGGGEVSFIPRESANSLQVRITVKDFVTGEIYGTVEGIVNSSIEGGKEYTMSEGSAMEERLRGKILTMKLSVFRPKDQVEEFCAEADYQVV